MDAMTKTRKHLPVFVPVCEQILSRKDAKTQRREYFA
jgi:hypothetical protein